MNTMAESAAMDFALKNNSFIPDRSSFVSPGSFTRAHT